MRAATSIWSVIVSSRASTHGSWLRRRRLSATSMTFASGVLISCATPAASWPTDASLSAWAARNSHPRCSERSTATPRKWVTSPPPVRIPVMLRRTGRSRPCRSRFVISPDQ